MCNHLQPPLIHEPTLLQLAHKTHPILIPRKRIIHTEQHVLNLRIPQDTRHGVHTPVPARRDPEVLIIDLLKRPLPRAPPHAQLVDAPEHEGQHFAHVADDELEFWERVEEPRGEEPEDVGCDVRVPAEGGRGDGLRRGEREVAGVEGREHHFGRPRRVQVDGDVESLRGLEQREVFRPVVVCPG